MEVYMLTCGTRAILLCYIYVPEIGGFSADAT